MNDFYANKYNNEATEKDDDADADDLVEFCSQNIKYEDGKRLQVKA